MEVHRLVEACALLPLLHTDPSQKNSVLCVGPLAERMAVAALRWRDIEAVYLLDAPGTLRDSRLHLGLPEAGTCAALLLSPDIQADPFLPALNKGGVAGLSTQQPGRVSPFFAQVRDQHRGRYLPWREWLPAPLYGAVVGTDTKPAKRRPVPGGAQRLSQQYLPCLFTFGADELPLVFGPPAE